MDLRSDPQSQKKPDGLPDMDVVLKESNKVRFFPLLVIGTLPMVTC